MGEDEGEGESASEGAGAGDGNGDYDSEGALVYAHLIDTLPLLSLTKSKPGMLDLPITVPTSTFFSASSSSFAQK